MPGGRHDFQVTVTNLTKYPANAANGAIATGFATDGPSNVPEPTSMLLLGLGLAGAGIARRRRKS
jgi:PEP-CTERM motif-containing protein